MTFRGFLCVSNNKIHVHVTCIFIRKDLSQDGKPYKKEQFARMNGIKNMQSTVKK